MSKDASVSREKALNQKAEREPASPDLAIPQRVVKHKVLVKVQLPLWSRTGYADNEGGAEGGVRSDAPALVYSEDRKQVLMEMPVERVRARMLPGEAKAFFWANVSDHAVEIADRHPKQDHGW